MDYNCRKGRGNMKKNIDFFKKHSSEFISKNFGDYVVISKQKIVGFYKNFPTAYRNALKAGKEGEFMVRRCLDNDTSQYMSYVY
jgi:hypothetical protein